MCFVLVSVNAQKKKEYYTSGELFSIGETLNGEKSGEWKTYYKSGSIKLISDFKKGLIHGVSKYYLENGNVKAVKEYKNGRIHGKATLYVYQYNKEYQLKKTGVFKNGLRVGEWHTYNKEGALLRTDVYDGEKRIAVYKLQDAVNNKAWKKAINDILGYPNSLFDYHNKKRGTKQLVRIKDSILNVTIYAVDYTIVQKAHLKNLKQIRNYKGDGFFLTFGWKNISFIKTSERTNTVLEKRKMMHLPFRVKNERVRKTLFNAFKHLVVLNKKKEKSN